MIHSVTEHILSTGTKGLLIDVPGSEVVNTKVLFRAGFQFGQSDKYEAPHLIEHHVFNATKAYTKNNDIMVQFRVNGAYNNAFTDPSYIGYVAENAQFETERIFDLFTELVARPLFPAEFYDTERENVRTELTRNLSDYARQAYVLSFEANFPWLGLNYADRLKQLDKITHEDVVNHYHATHQAKNATFIVAGATAANQELILSKLETLFGELPVGDMKEFNQQIGLGTAEPITAVEDIDSIYFSLNWFSDGVSPQERATIHLLRSILTGGFASRIYGKARDEGLTYHLSSSQDTSRAASAFALGGFCNPSKWQRLLELISEECSDIAANGPTTEELSSARQRVSGSITVGTQTASDVSGWYSGDYANDEIILSYSDYISQLDAVTVDDIRAQAQRFMSSKRHSATMVGAVKEPEITAVAKSLTPIWQ